MGRGVAWKEISTLQISVIRVLTKPRTDGPSELSKLPSSVVRNSQVEHWKPEQHSAHAYENPWHIENAVASLQGTCKALR